MPVTNGSDQDGLVPLLDATTAALGRTHGSTDPSGQRQLNPASLMAKMAAKLKHAGQRSRDRLRKQVVEPVIGQILIQLAGRL